MNLSSTRIKLPRPIVIDTTITQQKPMMNCQAEYLANNQKKKKNKHGNLKSIISRSQDDNGRVTYVVLWQDGTQTKVIKKKCILDIYIVATRFYIYIYILLYKAIK